ncbi:hypothetical protein OG756_07005 [Streptomyces sp. NBC_01310]|uniref:hypothetical protein n=1 Tax=Streptomyces sp. NBC_01310 TaxID=2903820 RepID=UPI0035B5E1D2|nr:hypothetical protein OG756_07005 [Streptomyces sp. NBC_01310]
MDLGVRTHARGGEPEGLGGRATAQNWIQAFGKGAGGKVTAEFYDEGSVRQLVVVYFHDTAQTKAFLVHITGHTGEDGWRVSMREPDPAEATAVAPWVPKKPGELGSTVLP